MTKIHPDKKTQNEIMGEVLDPDREMARARRIHAATSFTAAADMAILPISVVKSFSSARIRAKTGKAVIESATPMKTRNAVLLTSLDMVNRRINDVPIPIAKGRLIPAMAIARAFFPVRPRDLGSNSSPARNKKKMRPMFARVSNTVRLLVGNTACKYPLLRPKADGPSKIPPCHKVKFSRLTLAKLLLETVFLAARISNLMNYMY
jgi:hypothetical protein